MWSSTFSLRYFSFLFSGHGRQIFFPLRSLCPGVIPVDMWLSKWDFTDEIKVASQLTLKPKDDLGEPNLITGALQIPRVKQKSQLTPQSEKYSDRRGGRDSKHESPLLTLRMKGSTGLGMTVPSRSCKWALANSHRSHGTCIPQQCGTKFCL